MSIERLFIRFIVEGALVTTDFLKIRSVRLNSDLVIILIGKSKAS